MQTRLSQLPALSRERGGIVGVVSPLGEKETLFMLYWALIFLLVAVVAGALGFGGIAGASAGIAKILFFVFLVLLVISVIAHLSRGRVP
jgi:uncharacterized membrane protein YtjA (UPF0391 family)